MWSTTELGQAMHGEAPWQSSPFPLSLALDLPWEHPAPPSPLCPSQGAALGCPLGQGLLQTPQPLRQHQRWARR